MRSLKDKGNKAFDNNKLDEALKFYSEAIDMAKPSKGTPPDNLTLASLYSNRAQVHLKEKKYEEALVDVNESLKINPLLKKSLIRRAAANCELNNHPEAVVDLRKVFQFEPRNMTARLLMRRVSPPVKMSDELYQSYIYYFLRRGMVKVVRFFSKKDTENRRYKLMFLRQAFVSTNGPEFLRKYVNGSKVSEKLYSTYEEVFEMMHPDYLPWQPEEESPKRRSSTSSELTESTQDTYEMDIDCERALFILSHWFTIIRRKYESSNYTTSFPMCKWTFQTLLEVLQLNEMAFVFTNQEFYDAFGSVYHYSSTTYFKDVAFIHMETSEMDKEIFENNSNIFTRMVYFDEILQFEDTAFENATSLLVPKHCNINKRFLQVWKKKQWYFEEVIFTNSMSNLISFEKFGSIVSEDVNKVYLSIENKLDDFGNASQMKSFSDNLRILKCAFPDLFEVVGTFDWTETFERFTVFFTKHLKDFIAHLAAIFDGNVRPKWCPQLKVATNFNIVLSCAQLKKFDFKLLMDIVRECREEMENVRSIRCCGSSNKTFDWNEAICYFAAIKMETKNAQFQITFTHILEEISSLDDW